MGGPQPEREPVRPLGRGRVRGPLTGGRPATAYWTQAATTGAIARAANRADAEGRIQRRSRRWPGTPFRRESGTSLLRAEKGDVAEWH